MDENYKKYLDYMYCYFEILNNIVKTFNSISYKTDENDPFYNSKHFFDITTQLLRLLPYKYVNEEIELKHDGIFLLDYNVEFICEKYSKIIYNDLFFPGTYTFDINDDFKFAKENDYANFLNGILSCMKKHNYTFPCGFEVLIASNVPSAGGISSSSALSFHSCPDNHFLSAPPRIHLRLYGIQVNA